MSNKTAVLLKPVEIQATPPVTKEKTPEKHFKGAEKRLFERIMYHKRLATISIGDDLFSVRDLSSISLRFANTYNVAVPPSAFRATIHLLCGEDVQITGVIYRKLQYDMVIMMKKGIPFDLLEKESRYIQKMEERSAAAAENKTE